MGDDKYLLPSKKWPSELADVRRTLFRRVEEHMLGMTPESRAARFREVNGLGGNDVLGLDALLSRES